MREKGRDFHLLSEGVEWEEGWITQARFNPAQPKSAHTLACGPRRAGSSGWTDEQSIHADDSLANGDRFKEIVLSKGGLTRYFPSLSPFLSSPMEIAPLLSILEVCGHSSIKETDSLYSTLATAAIRSNNFHHFFFSLCLKLVLSRFPSYSPRKTRLGKFHSIIWAVFLFSWSFYPRSLYYLLQVPWMKWNLPLSSQLTPLVINKPAIFPDGKESKLASYLCASHQQLDSLLAC